MKKKHAHLRMTFGWRQGRLTLSLTRAMCYDACMFPDRQIIAARIVLDDRSRLPWRFFGRLTTAAIKA